jgi:nucleolar protein 56
MKAFIITTFIGTFAVNESHKVLFFNPFKENPTEMAEKLKLSELEIIDEEKQMQQELWKKGYKQFVFCVRKFGVKHVEPNSPAEQFVKENLRKLAIEKKVVRDQVEFNQLLTKVNLELTKVKIKKAIERDSLIIQANGAVDELDKSINVFVERLREFYGLHFPEMDRAISSHEKYAKIVEKYGLREKIDDPELKQFTQNSMGTEFTEEDLKAVQSLATQVLFLYKLRENLSKYLEKLLKEVAPNFSELAGPMLAAKLITKAGGLDKLARMPSSTVQLLGSEKALFRFLHGRGKSPRFGLLFNHPLIQNAPEKLKGRVARALASKLSIAAKMDYYSKKYNADEMKKQLQERVKEILSSK